jgi:hypothetical protein
VAGERPQGTPIFKELVTDPPTREAEFVNLWKLYITAIIVETARDYGISNSDINRVKETLIDQGILGTEFDLGRLLKKTLAYARGWTKPKSLETNITVDPSSGVPLFTAKISPGEPDDDERARGFVSIDRLIALAARGLSAASFNIWVLLDRLDVAFAETHELERNALRALFRVYLDIANLSSIKLKIFIRSDIWGDIVDHGFREASHITKELTIEWSQSSLLNLIIRRAIDNDALCKEYEVDKNAIMDDFASQKELFYHMFPDQVDQGSKKPSTLDWIVARCADGTGKTAPREVIHLLNNLREEEVKRLEQGNAVPQEGKLFDRSVFKAALPAVSTSRLVQTIYAEYPEFKTYLAKLEGEKTEQTLENLSDIWRPLQPHNAQSVVEKLVGIGFFQRRDTKGRITYWVPFLYRDALKMSQGKAGEATRAEDAEDD